MKATIKNYRRGRHTMYNNQYVVDPQGAKAKADAAKLVGMKAVWTTTSGKEIIGKVTHPHGGKGSVRVRFNQGLPGQAIGTAIELRGKGEKTEPKKAVKKPAKSKPAKSKPAKPKTTKPKTTKPKPASNPSTKQATKPTTPANKK